MDKDQMNVLHNMLQEELKSLQNKLDNNEEYGMGEALIHESLGELSSYDNHPADHGTEEFERGKDIALLEHDRHYMSDLEEALQRVEDGSYGVCETCGKEIPYERLLAVPHTKYCVEHAKEQSVSDRRPVEEEILDPSFRGTGPVRRNEDVGFDGRDAWNEVAKYGTSNPPDFFREGRDYEHLTIDEQRDSSGERGYVEKVENIASTEVDRDK